jgi:hypothetical protein
LDHEDTKVAKDTKDRVLKSRRRGKAEYAEVIRVITFYVLRFTFYVLRMTTGE